MGYIITIIAFIVLAAIAVGIMLGRSSADTGPAHLNPNEPGNKADPEYIETFRDSHPEKFGRSSDQPTSGPH